MTNPQIPLEYKETKIYHGNYCMLVVNNWLPGVTIGEGSTIGVNSVTKDTEPGCICWNSSCICKISWERKYN
jgi:acetyltransferase-like isoleucine patch superfamily enzyme